MQKQKTRKKGLMRLLEIAGTKKWLLVISGFLAVLHSVMALVPYILVYYVIKELTSPHMSFDLIWQYMGWAVGAAVISYALLYASGMASHVAAFNILYELRKNLAEKISRLSIGFINQKSSGAIKKIISTDIERIENFVAHQISDFIKGLVIPIITLIYLIILDWRMGLISLIPFTLVIIMIPYAFINKKIKELTKECLDSQENMNGVIVEYVRAMPVVKIFNQTVDAFEGYRNSVMGFRDHVINYMKSTTPPYAVIMSFMSNNLLPILALGSWLYFDNRLELSTFLLFLILGVGYIKPLFVLSNLGGQLYLIVQGMGRIDEILFAKEIPQEEVEANIDHNSVSFNNVTFSYENGVKALNNVSFEIPEGSTTAFVGPSGAGKSTAAQLIARFWDVNDGEITIGGVDIKNIPIKQLYEKVSFVFQDAFLFQDTVYENIRMGMDVSKEQIIAAAKVAQCHEFIEKLPLGYETRIGEGGIHFSGGEQQRIMLARVILKNSPIIILDEATAFADPDNEAKIQKAFGEIMKGKTVIVIAHRLSTITNCDQIIVFEDALINNIGTHKQLLEKSPLYKNMWKAHIQAKDFELGGDVI